MLPSTDVFAEIIRDPLTWLPATDVLPGECYFRNVSFLRKKASVVHGLSV